MKRHSIRSILSLVLALLMVLSMTASAFATEDDKKAEADSVRQEWNDLQNQIEEKREEMNALEAELKKVKKDKANTQYEKTLLDQRNAALQAEINLLQEQMEVSLDYNESKVGKVVTVLVEGFDPCSDAFYGRTYADAPEIDTKVYFTADTRPLEGTFVKVRVKEVMDYDLIGKMV